MVKATFVERMDQLAAELFSIPPPWDQLTCRQVLFLRHRLALVAHFEIARHYGISESGVRHALTRARRQFSEVEDEAGLLVLAARDGLEPLLLKDTEVSR